MTLTLIDKQDSFEIIRDKIASILVTEVSNQVALAIAAAKDETLWKLHVYLERSNPWEQFLNSQADQSPLVNIWYEGSEYDESSSNTIKTQNARSTYKIDCFAVGVSEDDGNGGFVPGDRQAAYNAHRALRLVRNILMAGEHTYLDLRGTVYRRWPVSMRSFQPDVNTTTVDIVGAQLTMAVDHGEVSPQVAGEIIEVINATIKRQSDGLVYFTGEFDCT